MAGGTRGDRVLTYAIVASLAAHVLGAGLVAGSFAARLRAPAAAHAPRYIRVDLIDPPKALAPKATRVARPEAIIRTQPPRQASALPFARVLAQPRPQHMPDPGRDVSPPQALVRTHQPRVTQATASSRPAGDPGSRLNVGATSTHGDLGGGWSGGHTPLGWVPSNDGGSGRGSGHGAGVGTPDPPRRADDGPGTRPAPAPPPPQPPPAPAMVRVKVCSASGDLPGDNCKQTRIESFVEGRQPSRKCSRCKAPEPEFVPRLADRAEPVLSKDSRVSIPSSVEEGFSGTVKIEYTVTADGGVTDVQVTKSSGNRAVDRAVVESAQRLKYQPAVQNGVPRSVRKTRQYTINT